MGVPRTELHEMRVLKIMMDQTAFLQLLADEWVTRDNRRDGWRWHQTWLKLDGSVWAHCWCRPIDGADEMVQD